MDKSEIRISTVIAHILDTGLGEPVFSNTVLSYGSDFGDFIREHIHKVMTSDDAKACHFYEGESRVFELLKDYSNENFVGISLDIAVHLFEIMKANDEIPSADLIIAHYAYGTKEFLAILKMNFKIGFTHRQLTGSEGKDMVDIVPFRSLLPMQGQKLSEAAVIDLSDKSLTVLEKKYNVNGVKTNYFSSLFLGCNSALSPKSRMAIVNKTIEQVQEDFAPEAAPFKERMETKKAIFHELEKAGEVDVPAVIDKVFESAPQMAAAAKEELSKYNIDKTPIQPKNDRMIKKYGTQIVSTDTGVELKIPMDQYEDADAIEFVDNPDGSMTILIKNVGTITAR